MINIKDLKHASFALLSGLAVALARTVDRTGNPQARAFLEHVFDAIPAAK